MSGGWVPLPVLGREVGAQNHGILTKVILDNFMGFYDWNGDVAEIPGAVCQYGMGFL